MNRVYLLTGGNLDDRYALLMEAARLIELNIGNIEARSSVYETEPWGFSEQSPFLNQVLFVNTVLTAEKILQSVLSIEEKLGRKREEKMGPRTIDIDILFYNEDIIDNPGLRVPHPYIQKRRFVLVPLAEISCDYIHPVEKKCIQELLNRCEDPLEVNKYNPG